MFNERRQSAQKVLLAFLVLGFFGCSQNTLNTPRVAQKLPVSFEKKDPECSVEPCTVVQIKLPVIPEDDLSPLVRTRIEGEIKDVVLERVVGEGVAESPEMLADEVLSLYSEEKGKGSANPWKIQRAGQVLFSNHDVLTLEVIGYEYTGGAHGMAWRKLFSFDLKDGKRLTLKDVVSEEQWKTFTTVAEFEFRRMREVPPGKTLKEAGFTFRDGQEFLVSENFGIVGDGIVIQYNPYDVAPYSDGPTELMIPALSLRAVLNRSATSVKHLMDDTSGAVSVALTSDKK